MGSDRDVYLERVKGIVLEALADYPVRVYLFGSRARGAGRRTSDVDVAIDSDEPLPPIMLSNLREDLEESTVPYFVDVIDMESVSPEFRRRILSEGVPWKT